MRVDARLRKDGARPRLIDALPAALDAKHGIPPSYVFRRDPLNRDIVRTRAFQNPVAFGPARGSHGQVAVGLDKFRAAFVFQHFPQRVRASD
jgi:hypothetical protein